MSSKFLRSLTLAIAAITSTAAAPALAGNFGYGNLVVEQLTGTSANATPINILEYTKSGSSVQTISFPSSGANQQTDSASASSNGYINTYNGYLSVPGQNLAAGTASAQSSNTKVNSILDTSGTVVTRTLFPTSGTMPYTTNNYRSSIATSGSTFYAAGTGNSNTGGIWYNDGTSFIQVSATGSGLVNNMRNVEIYNNQLYFSSSSGAFLGVSSLGTGLPTTAGQSATLQIDLGTNGSPYGFVMFDTNADNVLDRAYVADDRTTALNGGINRFDFSSGAWSRTSALRFDTTSGLLTSGTSGANVVSIRGLAGTYDSLTSTASLFATTTEASNNRLISFLDSGSLSTSTAFSTLASAGTNQVFRGVDIAPVPEPSALALAGLGVAAAGWGVWRRRVNGRIVKI
ncbi:MAG: PEP-CTERM sorting domain-containing protein [Planctomycetia bacterium]